MSLPRHVPASWGGAGLGLAASEISALR